MKKWKDIKISKGNAGKGEARQIDATLPNGKPVRILKTDAGYHVAVGDAIKEGTPPAVGSDTVWDIIKRALGE